MKITGPRMSPLNSSFHLSLGSQTFRWFWHMQSMSSQRSFRGNLLYPQKQEIRTSTWQFMTLPCSSKCTRHWLSVSQRESTNFFCKYDFKNVLHWQAQKKRQSGEDTKEENNFNHQSFQDRCKLRRNFRMNTR